MKKIKKYIMVLMSLVLIASACMPVYAAEENINQSGQKIDVGVYAKVSEHTQWDYTADIRDKEATVEVDDQMAISVIDAPKGAVKLVIVPIPQTEQEAWEWINSCTEEKGTAKHSFLIFFLDQDGKQLSAEGAKVTITCTHCAYEPMVCSLKTDETVTELAKSSVGKGSVTFTADGSDYYVMLEMSDDDEKPGGDDQKPGDDEKPGDDIQKPGNDQKPGGDTQNPSDTQKPGSNQKPSGDTGSQNTKTGDSSALYQWFGICMISLIGIAVIWNRKRKRV